MHSSIVLVSDDSHDFCIIFLNITYNILSASLMNSITMIRVNIKRLI
jgi:hypothetical protein